MKGLHKIKNNNNNKNICLKCIIQLKYNLK